MRHHCSGSDDTAITDVNAGQQDHLIADPYIITDDDRLLRLKILMHHRDIRSVKAVVSGNDGAVVKVHKLGGSEWKKTKARVRTKIQDVANQLLKIYAMIMTL